MTEAAAEHARLVGAVLGAWVLLSNPSPQALYAPAAQWEDVGTYATAFECETARRDEAVALAEKRAKGGKPAEGAALENMLRYRCAYTKHPRPRWQRWLRKAVERLSFGGGSRR
jgi:hypothetical protein